jgi:hypothetical protein
VLRQLRGPAQRREGDDRAQLAIAVAQRGLRIHLAVDELHDVPAEVAETLDGPQRLLVVDLQEAFAASAVPLVIALFVVHGGAPYPRRTRSPARPRTM